MALITIAAVFLSQRAQAAEPRTAQPVEIRKPRIIRLAPVPAARAPVIASAPAPKRSIFSDVPNARPDAQIAALGLQPAQFTPYDRYLDNVWPVLRGLGEQEVSWLRVIRLMERGHGFQYSLTDPYRAEPPRVTAQARSGDCKSKALWLCAELDDSSALWVVGKKMRSSPENHAWVYWRNEGRWYVLDCTDGVAPIPADMLPRDRYVPYYSFGKTGAFRHAATRITVARAGRRGL